MSRLLAGSAATLMREAPNTFEGVLVARQDGADAADLIASALQVSLHRRSKLVAAQWHIVSCTVRHCIFIIMLLHEARWVYCGPPRALQPPGTSLKRMGACVARRASQGGESSTCQLEHQPLTMTQQSHRH